MNKLQIRKIDKSDLRQCSMVFKNVFQDIGEKWTTEYSYNHVEENYNPNYCYLAEENNKIIGIMLAKVKTLVKGPELFIDTLAVLPTYQKQGIGQKLLDVAIIIVQRDKLTGFSLFANPKLKSYNWYKHMGMVESGWIELYKLNKKS